MKEKKMLSIVSAILVCTFSCAASLVSAYTPTIEQVNDYDPKMLVKHYLDSGMDKDEILEQFDTTTKLPLELTVQNRYESEIIDFYVKNNLHSKNTKDPKDDFVTKADSPDLSTCKIWATTDVLKEIMNQEWYVSYEFSVSNVKTAEEIKTIHLDDYRGNVEKNKTDSIQIFVGWNREMSPEEIQEHLSPNAKIIFKMDENPNNVKYYQLEIPKSEAEYYAELYEDEKKEYAVTFISCASFTEEDSLSNSDDTGDVFSDGSIDVTDLTALSLTLLGDMDLTAEQQKAADVDGDGAVTLADLARLQQYLSKKIDSLAPKSNVINSMNDREKLMIGYYNETISKPELPSKRPRLALKCDPFCNFNETLIVDVVMADNSFKSEDFELGCFYDQEIYRCNHFNYNYLSDEKFIVNNVNSKYQKEYRKKEEIEKFSLSEKNDDFNYYWHETAELDFSNYNKGESGTIAFTYTKYYDETRNTYLQARQFIYFCVGESGIYFSGISEDDAKKSSAFNDSLDK